MTEKSTQKNDPILPTENHPIISPHNILKSYIQEYWKPTVVAGGPAGAIITSLYYISHGPAPLDSISSLGALAIVISMIALFISAIFLLMWTMPQILKILLRYGDPDGVLSHWFEHQRNGVKASPTRKFLKQFLFITGTHAVTWTLLINHTMPSVFEDGNETKLPLIAILICASILHLDYITHSIKNNYTFTHDKTGTIALRFIFLAVHTITSLAPLGLFLVLLTISDFRQENEISNIRVIIACGFLAATLVNAIGFHIFDAIKGPRAFGLATLFGLYSLTIVIVALGASNRWLEVTMKIASVRIENTTLAIDGKNCTLINSLGITTTNPGNVSDYCLLENVNIISRLGERWVLDCNRNNPLTENNLRQIRRTFQIDAKSVLAQIDSSMEARKTTSKTPLCDAPPAPSGR